MRLGVTALALLLTACPADRREQTTRVGSFLPLPPRMDRPPLTANAVIGDLRAPESILHDISQDVYYITNVNGSMQGFDNNGFISRVHPETMVVQLGWIMGGRNGVTPRPPRRRDRPALAARRLERHPLSPRT